jgi:plastocyanin
MKKIAASALVLSILISTLTFSRPVHAATHAVTAGSNGPGCNDGGYFTPSSITIASGDTITFSVPANDPYAPGLMVHLTLLPP